MQRLCNASLRPPTRWWQSCDKRGREVPQSLIRRKQPKQPPHQAKRELFPLPALPTVQVKMSRTLGRESGGAMRSTLSLFRFPNPSARRFRRGVTISLDKF